MKIGPLTRVVTIEPRHLPVPSVLEDDELSADAVQEVAEDSGLGLGEVLPEVRVDPAPVDRPGLP